MQNQERYMQEYIRQLYVSIPTLDIVAAITIIILVTGFFEKVLDIDFIGRRVLRAIWFVIKFIGRRLLMPFKPEFEKIKPGFDLLKKFAINSNEVEEQLAALLTIKKDRTDQITEINQKLSMMVEANSKRDEVLLTIGESIHEMKHELTYNGGESVKDTLTTVRSMLEDSVKDRKLIKAQLVIEDKLSDRMTFQVDKDKKCVFISNAFLKYFGWIENDILGDMWSFCIDDRDLAIVDIKWDLAYRNKTRYFNKQHLKDSIGVSHYCLVVAYPVIINKEIESFRGVVELLDENDERVNLKPIKIHQTDS